MPFFRSSRAADGIGEVLLDKLYSAARVQRVGAGGVVQKQRAKLMSPDTSASDADLYTPDMARGSANRIGPQSNGKDPPMNVSHEIRRFIVENIVFGDESRLDETTSFEASGIFDSLGMIELITFVEERFGIKVSDTEIVPENFDSVQRVATFVERRLPSATVH